MNGRKKAPVLALWDIDGTILRGGGIGRRTLEAAFREVLDEREVDLGSVQFGGQTDPYIIGAGLELMGRAPDDALIDAIARSYLRILAHEAEVQRPFVRLAGVLEVVTELAEAGVHQGLGTGNLESAAWLKVAAVGLGGRFHYGGFGSDARDRGELLRIGAQRGAEQLAAAREHCRVIVIGDTLRDIAAARAIGADVVAVATGGETLEVLAAAGPEVLLPSLGERDAAAMILRLVEEA